MEGHHTKIFVGVGKTVLKTLIMITMECFHIDKAQEMKLLLL
jgi:hypothetical protein